MRLLRVIASMDPTSGGPCQGIRNSIPQLKKLGIHNEVVTTDDPSSSFLGLDNFIVHALGPGKSQWNYNRKLIPWLLENFDRFDTVIIHGLWQYHSYAVRRALKIYKRKQNIELKIYIMPHGMLDPYFQKAPSRKLKAIRNFVYWKLVEGKVINNVDGVLFTCEAELQIARETFIPYHPKNEINVGYGIATPPDWNSSMVKAFNKACPTVKDEPYLLFLSRIHTKKGVDLLIEAYKKIANRIYKANEHALSISKERGMQELETNTSNLRLPKLVIAGPGLDTPYGEKLMKLTSETESIKDSILFTGMLTGDAKWGAFYGCVAFILPSHQENFGIAVVEALACGKPVLISNKVNILREIESENAGIVADDTLIGTLELLEKWLGINEFERQIMKQNSRKAFEKHFTIEHNALKFIEALTV
jgi:glycosyltransferase involved in cell wall biosynthesis